MGKIKPKRKEIYGVYDNNGLRYLTQLRLDLNPLKYYKFDHNFLDTVSSMCTSNDGVEDAEHFLLHFHEFKDIRNTLMSNVSQKIKSDILSFNPNTIVKTLLYGNKRYKKDVNTFILNQTIDFIKMSKRFDKANDADDS